MAGPISLLQAKTLALASVSVAPVKRVPLADARGLFLADGISARRASPTTDVASLDGWALASVDLKGARKDHPVVLRRLNAEPDRDLKPGEAMKVLADATVPFGADAVVRGDGASDDGHRLTVFSEVHAGQNVRRRGEEWAEGELILSPGHRLDAPALAVLAAMGVADVPVRPLTRVALLTLEEPLMLPAVAAMVADSGAEVVAQESCGDREDAISGTLRRFVARADMVICCPKRTQREHVMGAITKLGGTVGFDGVALKPGRHAAVAMLSGKPIALLPGPPLATLAAFDQLVQPMLFKHQGVVEKGSRLHVHIDAPLKKRVGRTLLVPARLEEAGGEQFATFRAPAAAYAIGALGMDGWLVLPPEQGDLHRGDPVEIELRGRGRFRPLFTDPSEETTR